MSETPREVFEALLVSMLETGEYQPPGWNMEQVRAEWLARFDAASTCRPPRADHEWIDATAHDQAAVGLQFFICAHCPAHRTEPRAECPPEPPR